MRYQLLSKASKDENGDIAGETIGKYSKNNNEYKIDDNLILTPITEKNRNIEIVLGNWKVSISPATREVVEISSKDIKLERTKEIGDKLVVYDPNID